MSGIDWGTVPAWLSAVLTGGSLLLGFYILLRDRRKAEQADALKLICWRGLGNDGYTTHVLNASDRTVHNVTMHGMLRDGQKEPLFEGFPVAGTLRADEEKAVETPRRIGGTKVIPWAVSFTDSDGASWLRDLTTGRLHEYGRPRLFGKYARMNWRERRYKAHAIRELKRTY
ncbi:hypothetical protein [Streptomyces sp. NBC_01451]|uniref:hypothetical protein n=1 Tax=Streptomyces sp. NBC_01451 TaxID=2903872 RepID=UPI002E30634E|nr:hypothetical protein [Streptomyces sp. NBC_01451]